MAGKGLRSTAVKVNVDEVNQAAAAVRNLLNEWAALAQQGPIRLEVQITTTGDTSGLDAAKAAQGGNS
jgi:hypothetical protein